MSSQFKKGSMSFITQDGNKKNIRINFLACIDCPIGFQKNMDDAKGCDCVCDEMLGSYITSCNYIREIVIKTGTTAWITYLNTVNTSYFLTYPHCPMDYCLPPDMTSI